MKQKPFGMSVLTFNMANRLRPIVKEETRLRKLETKMEANHIDPTIAANVLAWQKQRHGRAV